MADLRGVLDGNRGSVSRLGSKKSGIKSYLNTWKNMFTSELSFDPKTGLYEFSVLLRDLDSGKSEVVYQKTHIK